MKAAELQRQKGTLVQSSNRNHFINSVVSWIPVAAPALPAAQARPQVLTVQARQGRAALAHPAPGRQAA